MTDKPNRILTIMHQEGSTPGRCGMVLESMGYHMVACRPPLGDELPSTLEDYAGVVVFGGPMSANDEDEFIKREIDWMEVPLNWLFSLRCILLFCSCSVSTIT